MQLSDYFEGAAAKYLSAVDANPKKSNQHEIGGLPSVGFKQYLGEPARGDSYEIKGRLVYISGDDSPPVICDGDLTWYGATRKDPKRPLEYRLYYKNNIVTELFNEGDFFLIAKPKSGPLLLIFTKPDSSIESQLRYLFGLTSIDNSFTEGKLNKQDLVLPLILLLEDIGIRVQSPQTSDSYLLEQMLQRFGGREFPSTLDFSTYARDTVDEYFDPTEQPDEALICWMSHEERLFRIYEKNCVQTRLQAGFGEDGSHVDEFISFSLSVQNRRKSRVGHAFENHLNQLFKINKLQFEQGRGKSKVTENNSKPDFLFPGFSAYHDKNYDSSKLIMLGAKTTCKDRWRQVLSEANRIPTKHLVTLEAAITDSQTNEMQSHQLQLVVPKQIHSTYTDKQQLWLNSVGDFINFVREKQK